MNYTSGLATEPSYAAQQIIYLYLLGEFGYKNNIKISINLYGTHDYEKQERVAIETRLHRIRN